MSALTYFFFLLLFSPLAMQGDSLPAAKKDHLTFERSSTTDPKSAIRFINKILPSSILTKPLSHRKTAKIQLPSGMTITLISDPTARKSAGACIVTGANPLTPIAQITQELIISQIPPASYEKTGFFRSWTEKEASCFVFGCDHPHFAKLLDHFAGKISQLKVTNSALARSLARCQLKSDNSALSPLEQLLFDQSPSELLSRVNASEVISWHKATYCGPNICLLICSPLPIDELITLSHALFCSTLKNPQPGSSSCFAENPTHHKLRKWAGHLIATKDPHHPLPTLEIAWPIPKTQRTDFMSCLDVMVTSKHHGGLYDRLQSGGLIKKITTRTFFVTQTTRLFCLHLTLTPKGSYEFEKVVETVYQMLHQIKHHQIPRCIFDQLQTMDKLRYIYQPKKPLVDELTKLAKQQAAQGFFQDLTLPCALPFFTKQETARFFANLTPEKALYFLSGSLKCPVTMEDPLVNNTKIPHTIYTVDPDQLKAWSVTRPLSRFFLPQPNPFIPYNLQLDHARAKSVFSSPKVICLEQNDYGQANFWQDCYYQTPKIHWLFTIKTPLLDGSAKQTALGQLLCSIFRATSAEILSYGENAGLVANLNLTSPFAFTLEIKGYRDKATIFLDELIKRITLLGELPSGVFARARDELLLQLTSCYEPLFDTNQTKMIPTEVKELIATLVVCPWPTLLDQKAALQEVTKEDFTLFSEAAFDKTYIEATLAGNMSQKKASKVWNMVTSSFCHALYPKKDHKETIFFTLKEKAGPYICSMPCSKPAHGATFLLICPSSSYNAQAASAIFTKLVAKDLRETFYTNQNISNCMSQIALFHQKSAAIVCFLLSKKLPARELSFRLDLFFDLYAKNLREKIDKARFLDAKAHLINELTTFPLNLSKAAKRIHQKSFSKTGYWGAEYENNPDTISEQLIALKHLTYNQFVDLITCLLSRNNAKRAVILCKGSLSPDSLNPYALKTANDLKKAGTYLAIP